MKTSIFDAPVISPFFHHLSKFMFRLFGWKVAGLLPDLPKFVVVAAPHTSNFDFILFLGMVFYWRASSIHYMGKAELFRGPFGAFFRWCGGYPVDRTKSSGLVGQMSAAFQESERFILLIAPEGTRYKVNEWKTGFYHIAKSVSVPVVLAYVDSRIKTCGVGPTIPLTDDMDADIKTIQQFYAGKVGIHPHRTSEL